MSCRLLAKTDAPPRCHLPWPTVPHVLHDVGVGRPEISKLPGVTGVDVDVTAGTVRVSGEPLPGDAPLREAIEEAGYEFVG
jgi:copper chaperone CopZ